MLIGTAGHIDHGKSALLRALTGQKTDRLPQEKAQGITIDLGYLYVPLTDGSVLGFIDMPGHEKLIHTLLAGAAAIDMALLVVAADDGPMPQTVEHLELLQLLDVRKMVVALNKIDAVDAARGAAAQRAVRDLLAGSAFANSPIFPLSSLTGEGVAALREHLFSAALAQPERAAGGRFRLAVDRSFTLDGVGTVATGTALAGAVAVGDELLAFPLGARVRVRDLRVQDETAAQGRVGQRCALALRGVDKQALRRGAWLVDPALNFPVSRFQAELRVPARHEPLKHMQRVHVHLGTDDIVGRVSVLSGRQIESGASGYVEILLERSCLALHGDRFVLRDAGARRTVGGGRVLDIHPPARHKRTPERLASLKAASTLDAKQALAHLLETSATGVELEPFSLSWNLTGDELGSLHAANLPIYTEGKSRIALAPGRFEELQQRLLEILAQSHAEAPDLPGLEGGQLRRKLSPRLAAAVFDALVHALRRAGRLAQTRSWLHLPAHRAELSSDDRRAFARLRPLLDATPYNPPRVRAVARADGTPEYEVRRLFKRLARAGELYPVARDHYFTAEAVAELAVCVRRLNAEQGAARAAAFRDRIYPDGGGGRKVAIQILEFFDRIGYTRRVRDEHLLSTSEGQLLW